MTNTFMNNEFYDAFTCFSVADNDANILPGGMSYAGNYGGILLVFDHIEYSITATFTLCTGDNLSGTCVEKSISFVP